VVVCILPEFNAVGGSSYPIAKHRCLFFLYLRQGMGGGGLLCPDVPTSSSNIGVFSLRMNTEKSDNV